MDNLQKTLERIEDTLADIDRRVRTIETFIAEARGRKLMLTSIQEVLIFVCVWLSQPVHLFFACSGSLFW